VQFSKIVPDSGRSQGCHGYPLFSARCCLVPPKPKLIYILLISLKKNMNVPMQVASDYGIWYKHSDNIGLSLGKL